MASEGGELDLYADDIGDEFSQENEYNNDSDLYDDVITSNSKSRAGGPGGAGGGAGGASNVSMKDESDVYNGSSNQSQNSNHSNNSNLLSTHHHHNNNSSHDGGSGGSMMNSSKKPCIYVGNLTWWTTDEDVIRAMASVGVNDVVEIKFFENRANGQSKGFCVVTLASEASVRASMDKLSKVELYGQTIAVTMCNRQNLNHFEMKSRKPGQNGQPNNQNYNQGNNMSNNRNNYGQNQNMNMQGSSGRPPLLPGRPGALGGGRPNNGPLLNSQPRLPQMPHQALPFGGANAQQYMQQLMQQQNGPRNAMHNAGGPGGLNSMMRMPQVGMPGVGQHTLNAVSAIFGSQQGLQLPPNAGGDRFGNQFAGLTPYGQGHPGSDGFGRPGMDMGIAMGEAEFEEILAKNKNVANNAVTRAVSDAASGDYSAAIDTLATAISLISQSRVAHDDRCKIIISSLKDTLQGIESKSYSSGGDRGGRSKDHRPRSRERSRERGSSRREKSSRRERSRSREYRERSRDRHYDDRHYDERRDDRKEYRDRDRDRDRRDDRDHRSRH